MLALDSFDVSLGPSEPARLLRLAGDELAPQNWTLLDFTPADGWAGAMAFISKGQPFELVKQALL